MTKKAKSSRISGFYKLPLRERLEAVAEFAGLNEDETATLKREGSLEFASAERMIENVIGTMPLPLGIGINFLINGKDYLIPMVIEEPSVVAAASNAARISRVKGGFQAGSDEPIMIGQIQLVDAEPYAAKEIILANKQKILEIANEMDPILVGMGGGAKDIDVRILEDASMVIVHLLVNCKDAMGANVVNTMAEGAAPFIEELTGGRVHLRIVSNLASYRLARAKAVFDKEALGGDDVVDGILEAYAFAASDPYRCATHNKGIMNGISAVTLATGNDTRAIEAGAHSYAAAGGKYKPLTTYEKNEDCDLVGRIELPLAVGIIGGATSTHPVAKINLKILGVKTARELAEVMASAGLAQNLAALRALSSEGIQRGHMELHARNIAIMAGAKDDLIEKVVERMVKEKKIRLDRAKEILEGMEV
ncbi:MAG: hydroxymethylglutaryl-CoA reductase, degradative [Candidatus Altiarchaeales archaeon WOR_SM1_86-2]|nr:MAG: hydroxymethylglutaryl-CoA reductase, degradative [Candidatus Altiarchaeales archaeon WOR_SM1_86-2]